MKILALAAALAGLSVAPAWADPPPAAAPPYRAGVSLQPVALYDKDGNVIGVLTGSVTPAGTSGGQAQAVQGITGGVPLPIQGGKRHGGADRRLGDDAAGQCRGAAAAGGRRHRCEPGDGDRLPRGIGQRAATFTDATGAAVAANATFTGAVRDLGAAARLCPDERRDLLGAERHGHHPGLPGCRLRHRPRGRVAAGQYLHQRLGDRQRTGPCPLHAPGVPERLDGRQRQHQQQPHGELMCCASSILPPRS